MANMPHNIPYKTIYTSFTNG